MTSLTGRDRVHSLGDDGGSGGDVEGISWKEGETAGGHDSAAKDASSAGASREVRRSENSRGRNSQASALHGPSR